MNSPGIFYACNVFEGRGASKLGKDQRTKDAAFVITVGSFLLTVEPSYLQLTISAFLLTVGASCLHF